MLPKIIPFTAYKKQHPEVIEEFTEFVLEDFDIIKRPEYNDEDSALIDRQVKSLYRGSVLNDLRKWRNAIDKSISDIQIDELATQASLN